MLEALGPLGPADDLGEGIVERDELARVHAAPRGGTRHAAGILAHHRRVLEPLNDPDLTFMLGAKNIFTRQHFEQLIGVVLNLSVGSDNRSDTEFERFFIAGHKTNGCVYRGHTRGDGVAQSARRSERLIY